MDQAETSTMVTKGGVASLRQWIKTLEMESAERQKALEATKARHNAIRSDNANLRLSIRKLSPKMKQIDLQREELNKLRSELDASSKSQNNLLSRLSELKTGNSDLHDKLESQLGEMSSLERTRQTDKEQIQNLSRCIKDLECQIELGRTCLQKKDEEIRRKDAALQELNSAVLEHTEIISMLNERRSQLEAEISRPHDQTSVGKPLSICEEIRMCSANVDQETPPVASKSVTDGTRAYWRMPAVLSWASFAVGFSGTLLLMLMLIGTAMPLCRPVPQVPCQDLVRDVLPSMLQPYCDLNFPHTLPF